MGVFQSRECRESDPPELTFAIDDANREDASVEARMAAKSLLELRRRLAIAEAWYSSDKLRQELTGQTFYPFSVDRLIRKYRKVGTYIEDARYVGQQSRWTCTQLKTASINVGAIEYQRDKLERIAASSVVHQPE